MPRSDYVRPPRIKHQPSSLRLVRALRSRCGRRAAATGVALVLGAIAVPAAQASSIVYVSAGDVWLANPDGSGTRQVTTAGGYSSPSQADDGTILALHGTSEIVRMDRQGRPLPGPGVPPTPAGSGPLDPRVSPDGSKVAFHWITYQCDFCGGNLRTGTQISWADRATPADAFGYQRPEVHPSWISNSRLLLFGVGAEVVDIGTGADAGREWFRDAEYVPAPGEDIYYEGEVTRAGDKIALGGGVTGSNRPSARIRLFSANGPYPAKPTARCNLNNPTAAFENLTWSPDGSALAFEDAEGIWVMPVNLDDCSSLRPTLAVPGGQDPDWGPADVGTTVGYPPPCPPDRCRSGAEAAPRLSRLAVMPRRFRARRGAYIRFRLRPPPRSPCAWSGSLAAATAPCQARSPSTERPARTGCVSVHSSPVAGWRRAAIASRRSPRRGAAFRSRADHVHRPSLTPPSQKETSDVPIPQRIPVRAATPGRRRAARHPVRAGCRRACWRGFLHRLGPGRRG